MLYCFSYRCYSDRDWDLCDGDARYTVLVSPGAFLGEPGIDIPLTDVTRLHIDREANDDDHVA